jgi:hypothetical protein
MTWRKRAWRRRTRGQDSHGAIVEPGAFADKMVLHGGVALLTDRAI